MNKKDKRSKEEEDDDDDGNIVYCCVCSIGCVRVRVFKIILIIIWPILISYSGL